MSESYSNWYRSGTITAKKNSAILQGANTYWLNANIKPGDMFTVDSSKFYEVDTVDSNTQITLKTPYAESDITAGAYAIIQNFTSTLAAETAAMAAKVLLKHEKYIDEDMKTIKGASAFEVALNNGFVGTESEWLDTLNAYGIAKKNGYVGTMAQWLESLTAFGIAKQHGFTGSEADWLESLLAAGNWQLLDKRTNPLADEGEPISYGFYTMVDPNTVENGESWSSAARTYLNFGAVHNSIFRGKNLGTTFTDEQRATVRTGKFEDMYVGDYWTINGRKYEILGFNYDGHFYNSPANVILLQRGYWRQNTPGMHSSNDTSPGYFGCYARANENGELYKKQQTVLNDWGDDMYYNSQHLSSAVSNGVVTGWTGGNFGAELLSFRHLGYPPTKAEYNPAQDPSWLDCPYYLGAPKAFPYFLFAGTAWCNWGWFRDVVSQSKFGSSNGKALTASYAANKSYMGYSTWHTIAGGNTYRA